MDSAPVCSSYRYADGVIVTRTHGEATSQEQPTGTLRLRDPSLSKMMDAMTKEMITFLEAAGHVKACVEYLVSVCAHQQDGLGRR